MPFLPSGLKRPSSEISAQIGGEFGSERGDSDAHILCGASFHEDVPGPRAGGEACGDHSVAIGGLKNSESHSPLLDVGLVDDERWRGDGEDGGVKSGVKSDGRGEKRRSGVERKGGVEREREGIGERENQLEVGDPVLG